MRSRVNKRVKKNNDIVSNTINKIKNIEIDYTALLKLIIAILLYIVIFWTISGFIKRSNAINQFAESIDSFAQKNAETYFEVTDMILYSSASAQKNPQSVGLDISTFTDIAFNISNPKNVKITSLKIDNIAIETAPDAGTPVVNYKNPYDFGKLTNFDLTPASSIEYSISDYETDDFKEPVIYNNLCTPVTLTFLDKNVSTNFQVRSNDATIYYNGKLLKSANVNIATLASTISFDVIINEKYTCKLYVSIPYKTEKTTVADGYLLQEIPLNGSGKFYQL